MNRGITAVVITIASLIGFTATAQASQQASQQNGADSLRGLQTRTIEDAYPAPNPQVLSKPVNSIGNQGVTRSLPLARLGNDTELSLQTVTGDRRVNRFLGTALRYEDRVKVEVQTLD
jgi:hypothetical protein